MRNLADYDCTYLDYTYDYYYGSSYTYRDYSKCSSTDKGGYYDNWETKTYTCDYFYDKICTYTMYYTDTLASSSSTNGTSDVYDSATGSYYNSHNGAYYDGYFGSYYDG